MTQLYPGKLLSMQDRKGYRYVRIGVDKKKLTVAVHRLVLLAFAGEPGKLELCRHLDGNPSNNTPANLAWGTQLENMADRKAHGNYLSGEHHVMATLTDEQVINIYNSDGRTMDVAEQFGTCSTVVCAIRRGATWRSVTGGAPRESRIGKSHRKTDKLNAGKAGQIRELIAGGASQKAAAAKFGITQSAVSRIVNNKTWMQPA